MDEKKKARIEILKRMQNVACRMNLECAYEYWSMYGIPDEPSEDDYVDIADDDEQYEEIAQIFVNMIYRYAHYGILKG